jgi:hypothetical protein
MQRKIFIASGAATLLPGCARRASSARFADIDKGGGPLRSTFNHDADKVRIVMLVSPT